MENPPRIYEMLGIPWHFQSSIINQKNAPTKPGSRLPPSFPTIERVPKIHHVSEFSPAPKTKAKKNSKMPMGIKRACHSLHRILVQTRCGHMPLTFGSSRFTDSGSVGSQSLSSKTNKKAKLKNPKLSFQCIYPNKNHLSKSTLFLGLLSPRPCHEGIQTLKIDNMEIRPIAIFVQGDTDLEP